MYIRICTMESSNRITTHILRKNVNVNGYLTFPLVCHLSDRCHIFVKPSFQLRGSFSVIIPSKFSSRISKSKISVRSFGAFSRRRDDAVNISVLKASQHNIVRHFGSKRCDPLAGSSRSREKWRKLFRCESLQGPNKILCYILVINRREKSAFNRLRIKTRYDFNVPSRL